MLELKDLDLVELSDNAELGVFVLDKNYTILTVNNAFTHILKQKSKSDIIGKSILSWFDTEKSDELDFFLNTCLTVGSVSNFEFNFIISENESITLLVNASQKYTPENESIIVVFCQDITSLKKTIETITDAKNKAEDSDKLKTAFLSNLSHEIRTPMNAIIGFSELLMSNDLPLEQKEKYVNYINNSGTVLLKLIDDIIDIAKIQSKQLVTKKIKTNINTLLYEIYSSYSKMVKNEKGDNVELIWNIKDKDDRVKLLTDPLRFRQIFTNLLGNALKFTEKGSIEFGYEMDTKEDIKSIVFYVRDTGIGLSSLNKDVIFNRFYKIEDDSMRLYRGSGLGLTITKSLVDLLGGKIWVESQVGKGSCFYFSFPITDVQYENKIDVSDSSKTDFSKWSGKTILVAEDEEINFIYIEEILKRYNLNILHAKNGLEAVHIYKENQHLIKLILMDIKMPVMDGYEATQQIKSISSLVPIIAQTAYALTGEREKIIDAGCDDYLSKPLKPNGLISTIGKFLQ